MSDYPEHDKLAGVQDQTQAVGDFLEWVMAKHQCELGRPEGRNAGFRGIGKTVPQLLADWAGIDLDRLEQEKRAMLDVFRNSAVPS